MFFAAKKMPEMQVIDGEVVTDRGWGVRCPFLVQVVFGLCTAK